MVAGGESHEEGCKDVRTEGRIPKNEMFHVAAEQDKCLNVTNTLTFRNE